MTRGQRDGPGSFWAFSRGPSGLGLGDQEGVHGRLGPDGPYRGLGLDVGPDGIVSPKAGPNSSGPSSSEGPLHLRGFGNMEAVNSGGLYGGDDCHGPSGVALPLVWAGPRQLKESLFGSTMVGGDKLEWNFVSRRNQEPTAP